MLYFHKRRLRSMGLLLSLTIIEHFTAFNMTLRKCSVTCILNIHKLLILFAKEIKARLN